MNRSAIGLVVIAGLAVLVVGCAATPSYPAMDVAPQVDLQRYAGNWYEIARLPNKFQEQCVGNVTAVYEPLEDGRLRVINRCAAKDGSYTSVEGVARVAGRDQATLKVRFAPVWLALLPSVWGDYWILEVGPGPQYDYALVGEPSRTNLWVLSRTPTMSDSVYERLLKRAATEGYDVTRVRRTPQDGMKTTRSAAAGVAAR